MSYKIRSFTVDNNLMHLVQRISTDPTEEVLTYLYESAISIIEDFFNKKKLPKTLNRKNIFFYKRDTSLPITVEVYSAVSYYAQNQQTPEVGIIIKFPTNTTNMNVEQVQLLYREKLEKSLGLSDEVTRLVNFDTPKMKINKNLRGVL